MSKTTKPKIRVGIIFGGKSAEHEVSLQSAKNVIASLDKNKYEPVLIGIDKTGKWHVHQSSHFLLNEQNPKLIALNKQTAQDVALAPAEQSSQLVNLSGQGKNRGIDVVFPVLHGSNGEDGTMQGLLKIMDIPFVGPGVLGSALGMDKDVAKRLWRDAGIPIAKFLTVKAEQEKSISFTQAKKYLGLPMFIKPANAGSWWESVK